MIDLLFLLLGFLVGTVFTGFLIMFLLGWSSKNISIIKLAAYETELEEREERLERARARENTDQRN